MPTFHSRRSTVLTYPDGMAEYTPTPPTPPLTAKYIVATSGDLVLKSDTSYFIEGNVGTITVPPGCERVCVFGGGYEAEYVWMPQQTAEHPEPRCNDIWIENLIITSHPTDFAGINVFGTRIVIKDMIVGGAEYEGACLYGWGASDVAVVDCVMENDGAESGNFVQRVMNTTRFATWGGSRTGTTTYALRGHGANALTEYHWWSDMTVTGPLLCGFGSSSPPDTINHFTLRDLVVTAYEGEGAPNAGSCIRHAPSPGLSYFHVHDCDFTGTSAVAELADIEEDEDATWTHSGNSAQAPP